MDRRILLAVCLMLLLVAACSTTKETEPRTSERAAGAPAAESNSPAATSESIVGIVAPTVIPESVARPDAANLPRGGRLIMLFSDPPTLDPHLTTDNVSGTLVQEVYGGLVTIDPEIQIVPDLAESWEISSGGRIYTFHLRPDAKFHDGKQVKAEDVRWSLERSTDPLTESPVAEQYLSDILGVSAKINGEAQTTAGMRVVDDLTVELTIDAPKAYFLAKLTYPTGFVLDRRNVEGNPKEWLFKPNGTGPFKLVRYDLGEVMVLARNENYHLGPPFVDEVEFILSGGDAMLMYENDEIHLAGVGLADLERLQDPGNPLGAELRTAPSSFSVSYLGMNWNEAPFDDHKFRQALNYAVNKQEIATTVMADLNVPAKGIIPPRFPSYNPDLRGYNFNPEKAKQLLAQSRYGNDLDNLPRITLSIPGDFGAAVSPGMQAILRAWEVNLGVDVEIQHTEWATFLQDLNQRRFQMFAVGWGADYPDPENFLDILFHSKSSNNHMGYNNSEVDSLLEQARVESDQTARYKQYNRIEQMIIDDAPWIPLWHSRERKVLIKPSVKDYHLVPMTIPKLRYVYFETS